MFRIEQGTEEINSNGGIALVGVLLTGLKGLQAIDGMSMPGIRKGWMPHSDILKAATGLFTLGRSDFADIELFRSDPLFRDSLVLKRIPSEETLRQRLDDIARSNGSQTLVDDAVVELLLRVGEFGEEKTETGSYVPLDIDVSVLDNSNSAKENVAWTYKNVVGYAPIFAYLGTEGYMLANELRQGSQHSAKGAVAFVERCLDLAERTGVPAARTLLRADSGHDDKELLAMLSKRGVNFLIKRNMRNEPPEQKLAMARRVGEKVSSRDGKNVYHCVLSHCQAESLKNEPIFMIVEAIERLTTADGQPLLFPTVEVNTWWTNLPESEAACIRLYHNLGTSEQLHSELKSDMGIERLPSGKFLTNALILNLATLAFNCLRLLGQRALRLKELLPRPLKVARRRLRSVLQDLIHIGCKVVSHAGAKILKFGRNCPWFPVFRELYARC